MSSKKKVFVGMSGGVDSSLTASLLVESGHDVTGVYMKNWTEDLPGFDCPWKEDYYDAKQVAVALGIDFKVFDFQKEYKQKVVDYMLDEFRAGRTPNPDIMCNQEVKFKLFLDSALESGADMIATGHYAKTSDGKLFMAKDKNKDQTYFLYRVQSEALEKTLFPLGDFPDKATVRREAEKRGLVTANKKDSVGICFVGKVGIRDFLSQYIETESGDVIDQNGVKIGEHDGAIFYTIGQRHGLNIGGGFPYYVTGKDMKANKVFVTTDLNDKNLWSNEIRITDLHWIDSEPIRESKKLKVRTRHRAPLADVENIQINSNDETKATIWLKDDIRALTPGQSTVIYSGEECLGGGIVT